METILKLAVINPYQASHRHNWPVYEISLHITFPLNEWKVLLRKPCVIFYQEKSLYVCVEVTAEVGAIQCGQLVTEMYRLINYLIISIHRNYAFIGRKP